MNSLPPGPPNAGVVDEIENPNPQAGTNNWYTEDGYGGGSYGSASYGGGTYTDCSDLSQPGVSQIVSYLGALSQPIAPNCDPGHYYLLNNYNPGYYGNGTNAYLDIGNSRSNRLHDSAVASAHHRRLAERKAHLLGVLRRPVEHLPRQSLQQLRHRR